MSAHHLPDAAQLNNAAWRKSSRSNGNGGNNCVEVAFLDTIVAVRDSKNQSGPALFFSSAKAGEFDLDT
jgi:uncharacterized protein DUF397